VKTFNPSSRRSERALQAWLVLISVATNRQTIRYDTLSRLMFHEGVSGGLLAQTLGHIAFYCIDNNLPPLTVLVVNENGLPGEGIPVDPTQLHVKREEVYTFNWYNILPPSPEELERAYNDHR
jgi:hypothetical protein